MRVLYFSPVPWRSFVQRPQHFAQYLLEHKQAQVCWVDPYPTRLPAYSDLQQWWRGAATRSKPAAVQNSLMPAGLNLITVRALPIEPLAGSAWLNRQLWRAANQQIEHFLADPTCLIVVGKPSQQALDICARFPRHKRIYDAMDNFAYYYHGWSRRSMYRRTQHLQQIVDQVWASCHSMYGLDEVSDKVRYVLNACDLASLPELSTKAIDQRAPVFGFLGTVSERFDWGAVSTLAQYLQHHLPAASLRIIGPLHQPVPTQLAANIECLPACSHQQAIAAMQNFDVGLIPFHENLATNSIDPVKYYEYHALGLPIVSSYFGEMKNRRDEPGVFLYQQPGEIVSAARQSLSYQADQHEIARFRAQNNWQARFEHALRD